MKCLEFLYFYLMDETTQAVNGTTLLGSQSTPSTPVTTQVHTWTRLGGPKMFPRETSHSSFGSSSSSSRSAFSVATNSSESSIRTPSPVKKSHSTPVIASDPYTPPNSPPFLSRRTPRTASTRPMMLLRRDVDYEPQSPKKVHGSLMFVSEDISTPRRQEREEGHERVRTTEEKKEILGTLLGNVDALVEGVRKAGIWGLT